MMRIIASYSCTKYTTNRNLKMHQKRLLAQIICISLIFLSAAVSAQDDEFESLDSLEDLAPEAVQEEAEPEQDVVLDEEAEPEEPVAEEEEESETEETTASEGESQEATASTSGPVNRREISAEYVLRLQELEDRVNDLKEQIFRSKSRLVLLRERILGTRIGGSQARIMHINDIHSDDLYGIPEE